MADAVKAQKLAAARKRLKEYQKTQSNKKPVKNDLENVDCLQKYQTAASSGNVTPAESMASSTHSILDPSLLTQDIFHHQEMNAKISEPQPTSDLFVDNNASASFFNNSLFQSNENNHILSNYFDTLPIKTDSNNSFTQNFSENGHQNKREHLVETEVDKNNQNTTYADPFDSTEITGQNIMMNTHSNNIIEESTQSFLNSEQQVTPDRQESECALPEDLHVDTNKNQNTIFSNTESLRQLSSQLNSLIENESTLNATGISDLEKRNQELATLLKNEQMKTEQMNFQLREFATRITQLETECQQIKNEHDARISREIGPLQEQLQYHVQTVGILVGEKTELTIALNQSQATAKQKSSECEELQGRLKASRHRVAELEKEVNFLKSTKENFDKHEQENNRESERLRLEYNLLKDQYQETSEESSELREKLNAKINECLALQQELQEKNSQLSFAQLKVQQLTNGENIQIESQLEIINHQKISLEQQISELTQTVKTITAERDQASQQYQQYVQQLNTQIQNLAENLEAKNIENDNLSKREQSLVKHIGELEKHLQTERQTFQPSKNDNDVEIKKLEEALTSLRNENSELEAKYTEEINKRSELDAHLQQKEEMIFELEAMIEQLKDQPDAGKLLAAIESDKVAASRAVEQNKRLKQQLEELHDGFIKMSNSKLELTEKLQSEQHQNKDLSDKLSQSIAAVEHLHSVIAIKDKELTEVRNRETELQKQILQHNQLADRLRHYEAQGNSSDFLQQELQQAKQVVTRLTTANVTLTEKLNAVENNHAEVNTNTSDQNIEENVNLKEKVVELEKINSDLTEKLNLKGSEETDSVTTETYFDKEKAMEQLEERFKRTITEVAELTEEKQRLEHLVLQLQSETETIGEYVTLYQCQRAMLKEKTLEKDEQLKRLSHDREEMKLKLDELNALVQKLIIEKGILPKDLLHHNLLQNRTEACEIHKQEEGMKEETEEKIVNGNHDNNNENFGTAGKIISLLSEIKTSSLVQPGDSIQNFHPCPWCSGQLITV